MREQPVAATSLLSRGVQPDPGPDLLVDENPDGEGVGPWVPKDKHRLLTDYLHGTRGAWKDLSRRVLIDPFCGPGRIRVRAETFTRDGGSVAAWREMHNDGTPFTKVFVGDLDPAKAPACAARLQALGAIDRPQSEAEDILVAAAAPAGQAHENRKGAQAKPHAPLTSQAGAKAASSEATASR